MYYRVLYPSLIISAAFAATLALPAGTAHADPCAGEVMVERGDTLNRIADRCGVPLSIVLRENPHIDNPNIVSVGTVLTMPDAQMAREAAMGKVEAKPGDTLATIADRHGIPLAVLISANPDVHPEEVSSGTQVGLPDG